MQIFNLKNGMKVIVAKKKTDSVAINIIVKVGSSYENKNNYGISHFVEHMLFEGTKSRSAKELATEIESVGGEINGFTHHTATEYYSVVPKKWFNRALDVLSDLIQNPRFDKRAVEKEKKVVLEEMKLEKDNPATYRWFLFVKTLFKKNPVKNPILGIRRTILNLKQRDLIDFHKKYYIPNNMIVVISGDVNNAIKKVKEVFKNFKAWEQINLETLQEPKKTKPEIFVKKKEILHSYFVLGYQTVPRLHKDSYALDIINTILGSGASSRLYEEIRTKRGLAYEIGADNEAGIDWGYFAVYLSTDKKNLAKVKRLIFNELKLKNLTNKEIKDAKNQIDGNFILENEKNVERTLEIASWAVAGDVDSYENYITNIKKVKKSDILRAAKKYFTKNYTMAIIKQKKT